MPQTEIDSLTGIVLDLVADDALLARFRDEIDKLSLEYVWENVVSDLDQYATKQRKIFRSEQA